MVLYRRSGSSTKLDGGASAGGREAATARGVRRGPPACDRLQGAPSRPALRDAGADARLCNGDGANTDGWQRLDAVSPVFRRPVGTLMAPRAPLSDWDSTWMGAASLHRLSHQSSSADACSHCPPGWNTPKEQTATGWGVIRAPATESHSKQHKEKRTVLIQKSPVQKKPSSRPEPRPPHPTAGPCGLGTTRRRRAAAPPPPPCARLIRRRGGVLSGPWLGTCTPTRAPRPP